MRWLKATLFGALAASVLATPGAAQTRSHWTTTHEVARCATDADQPVCILRALANFPTHSPYSTDWRLAGAGDVLVALGEAGRGTGDQQYAHIPYESTRTVYGYLDATDAAVASAIVADRQGATPAEALRLVLGDIDIERLMPGANAGAQCMRLADIWRAYGSERERARRPNLPRPSLALARTALETCDRLNAPVDSASPHELAERYAQFGNAEAANRVIMRDTRPAEIVAVEIAVILEDWDRALELFSAPARTFDERATRPRFKHLRGEVFIKLRDAGRVELASALGRAAIEDFLIDETEENAGISGEALEFLAANGQRTEARRFVERFDSISRDTTQLRSMSAAIASVRGWVALGEIPRGRALADLWAPRVQWQYDNNNGGCGGSQPFCASYAVMDMYVRVGDVEEGWRVAHEGSVAWIYLGADFSSGRGLQLLDSHLAHTATEQGRDQLLGHCADRGNWTRQQLEWSATCARRLIDRAAANTSAPAAERSRQQRTAATAALKVSENAARQSDATLMDEMLARAFASYALTQDAPLTPAERASLLEIAIYQLGRANRL